MGAWGYGIRQDDTVLDIIGAFEEHLKTGLDVAGATKRVCKKYARLSKDADEGPLFWIALAEAQWTYGQLDPQVFERVKDDLSAGRGLSDWEDADGVSRRKVALKKFVAKLATPSRRPRKQPKQVSRTLIYQAGDCLCITLSNGQYAAALVLISDSTGTVGFGDYLIGVLDYLSSEKPPLPVFEERKWFVRKKKGDLPKSKEIDWFSTYGLRANKHRVSIVCNIKIRESDPTYSNGLSLWHNIGEVVLEQRQEEEPVVL